MSGHTFTVYKTETCPYCHQALRFLGALAKQRQDIEVEAVDAMAEPARFRKVARVVGRRTVPQIFLDGRYLGGWTELAQAARGGRLDAYLCGEPWTPPVKQRWFRR